MEVTLTRASIDDLPRLAEINRLAYTPETIAQFAFINWPDEVNMRVFSTERVKQRLIHPDTQVFKAVDRATAEIVGFVCWTLEESDQEKLDSVKSRPDPTSAAIQQIPSFLNMDFVVTTGAEIEGLKELMKEGKHYCRPLRIFATMKHVDQPYQTYRPSW
jgi:hypothetical protein